MIRILIIFAILHDQVIGQDNSTVGIDGDPLWRTYLQCKSVLGQKVLVCDPDNVLHMYRVRKQIDELLWRMQTDVPCYCSSEIDCTRYDGVPIQSGIVAAFIAFTGGDLPDQIDTISKRIYDESKLASDESSDDASACDNGLLLIYAIDTRSLFLFAGSAVEPVFDHLPTHRRRIEPDALIDYFDRMLNLLKNMPPEKVSINRLSVHGRGWGGWELIVGMIAALLIVALAGATLMSILITRCFGGVKTVTSPYMNSAFINYEKECKEWTKRARYLAKRRAKLMRAMQKPDWTKKLEAAKKRLSEKRSSSTGAILASSNCSEFGDQYQQTPYYIVSEPGAHVYPVQAYDEASIYTPNGTLRSENARRKRETQRRDFYFND